MGQLAELLKSAKERMDGGDYSEALRPLEAALGLEPPSGLKSEIHFQLAVCLYGLKRYADAAARLETALGLSVDTGLEEKRHIYDMLRFAYKEMPDYEKLAALCRGLIEYPEAGGEAVSDLLYACASMDKWEEMAATLDKCPDIDLGVKALLYKVSCFTKVGRFKEAFQASREYIEKFGEDHEICARLILLRYAAGDGAGGLAGYKKAAAKNSRPDWQLMAGSWMLGQDAYYGAVSDGELPKIVENLRRDTGRLQANFSFRGSLKPFRKLRLGYLSADLTTHPVGYFLLPVMASTVTSHCFIKCYSLMKPANEDNRVTRQIKSLSDEWEDVYARPDEYIEKKFLGDNIDIAFDMMCHSHGNRIRLYARRLAPVQISWIGFPVTSGVAAMDYVITDRDTDPPGSEKFYTEKLLYMPDNFLCHILTDNVPPEPPAVTRNGFVTFACFHNLVKVTDKTLGMWRRVLERVENSRLKIMGLLPKSEEGRELMYGRFRKIGMPMERVSVSPMCAMKDYFAAYNGVDIMLDTYPFSGATTTFDALRMGRPIITLAGKRHVTRVSYSLLKHVGLEGLAAFSEDEYVEKAVALANDADRLCEISAALPERLMKSKLTDQQAFRRNYEKILRDAWAGYCFEKRERAYDYSADSPPELLEQAINATAWLERKLDAGEEISAAAAAEYYSVQKAFCEKLSLVTKDGGYLEEYGKLVELIGRRLGGKSLRLAVMVAKRHLSVFCDGEW